MKARRLCITTRRLYLILNWFTNQWAAQDLLLIPIAQLHDGSLQLTIQNRYRLR